MTATVLAGDIGGTNSRLALYEVTGPGALTWLKKAGDPVSAGEPIVELETEKVDLEVGAEHAGVLLEVKRQEGEDVKVGEVLAAADYWERAARGGQGIAAWTTTVGLVVLAGTFFVADALRRVIAEAPPPSWVLLAALTWASGMFALRVPGASVFVSVSETFVFSSVIFFGPGPAVLTVAVDGLLSSLRQTGRRLDRTLFNRKR